MIQKFEFQQTVIEGLYEITPFIAWDERGCLLKDYSHEEFAKNGITYDLHEVFYTCSHKGVIRAMHFQRVKQQPKLVRCISGEIYDVVCDIRKDSPTYKKWLSFRLSGKNHKELLIPVGCAHGYLALKQSIVSYKCSEKFYGEYDDGILWNDLDLNIIWPVDEVEKIILSEKDKKLMTFKDYDKNVRDDNICESRVGIGNKYA